MSSFFEWAHFGPPWAHFWAQNESKMSSKRAHELKKDSFLKFLWKMRPKWVQNELTKLFSPFWVHNESKKCFKMAKYTFLQKAWAHFGLSLDSVWTHVGLICKILKIKHKLSPKSVLSVSFVTFNGHLISHKNRETGSKMSSKWVHKALNGLIMDSKWTQNELNINFVFLLVWMKIMSPKWGLTYLEWV